MGAKRPESLVNNKFCLKSQIKHFKYIFAYHVCDFKRMNTHKGIKSLLKTEISNPYTYLYSDCYFKLKFFCNNVHNS